MKGLDEKQRRLLRGYPELGRGVVLLTKTTIVAPPSQSFMNVTSVYHVVNGSVTYLVPQKEEFPFYL